jgi:uncharacterized protein YoxC
MDLAVSKNLLDITLVVSLGILAFSSIVFLIFIVPVLVQLTKTLEAANALVTTLRDYTKGITSGISSIGEGVMELGSKVFGFVGVIKDFLSGIRGRR